MEKRIYGLDDGYQARALSSFGGETESEIVAFLIGTQGLRNDNQLHLLRFSEDDDTLGVQVFNHDVGEVWDIATSASSRNIVSTCHSDVTGKSFGATVWEIPTEEDSDTGQVHDMKKLFALDTSEQQMKTLWHPQDTSKLISASANKLNLWDVDSGIATATLKSSANSRSDNEIFQSLRWNPHHSYAYIASAVGRNVRGWDLRSMEETFCIEKAHGSTIVRSLDFNPNKQYNMLSCGDDGRIKFWDVRNSGSSLLEFDSHSHWVWCARYNHFHDQLIISSSSDNQVTLSNAGSLSSGLLEHLEEDDDDDDDDCDGDDETSKPQPDGTIMTYEEHEESVYCVEWSTTDAWVFASLSYDGRFILNWVPNDIKYGILL